MSEFSGSSISGWSSIKISEESTNLAHIGSLGIVDDIFGIYGTPPEFVRLSLGFLAAFCAVALALSLLGSSICLSAITRSAIPRVNVAMGCLYRHIDPWYMTIPRMVTCAYLHLNMLHFVMNFTSLGGTFTMLRSTLAHSPNTDWVIYWCFPVWSLGALAGSVLTYTHSLGKSGSFTLGASGGVCAFSAFVILHLITQPHLREDQIASLISSMAFAVLHLLPLNVTDSARGPKADNDAHRGGFAMGILLAVIVNILQSKYDTLSLKRIGVILTLIFAGLSTISFLEVARQYFTGHSDRITKVYIRWMKIDQIKLREKGPNEPRRWTVAEIQGIDAKININTEDDRITARPCTGGLIDSLERAEIEEILYKRQASV